MTFRLAELEERIRRLDQERDAVNRILDAAVGALNFSPGAHGADPNGQASPEEEREGLLRETAQKVRALVPLRALAFYLLSEDGLDFRAALTDPVGAGKSFEAELEPLVEDGTLAWALNHPHPVFVTTADGSRPLLLHALSTPNRTLGVLLGEPSCDPQTLPDIALAFLRVVLNAAAGVLQDMERVHTVQDLNARLRDQVRRLEETRLALEEAHRTKDAFLAHISHEIRTPLNGILGLSRLLGEGDLSREQEEHVSLLLLEGQILVRLLDDLLDFSKIEAGRLEVESIPFAPGQLTRDVGRAFAHRASEKGLPVEVRVRDSVPPGALGDPNRLRQILGNLLSNAVKFTSRGRVLLELDAPGDRLVWSVEDTGEGVAPEALERIFQPFVQADPSVARRHGGTGLGLPISRSLATLMGGTLEVSSSPGEGSRFVLSLPLTAAPAPTKPQALREEAPPRVSRGRILLVEDNPTSRLVGLAFLRRLGFEAQGEESGEGALERLRRERFDGVLLDIQMPGMDGVETVRALRDPETGCRDPEVPVVALTAAVTPGQREKYLEAGMDDVLSKPLVPEDLSRVLGRLLPLPEAAPVFREEELLARTGGDAALAGQVLAAFEEDLRELCGAMDQALAAGDRPALRKAAHALRGAAANLGAPGIRDAAAALEEDSGEDEERTRRLRQSLAEQARAFEGRKRTPLATEGGQTGGQEGMRILVAEDNRSSRMMLTGFLQQKGYEVEVAEDGRRALDLLLQDDPPRLAVLDWMMPGLEGPEVVRWVRRANQRDKHYTYLILLTVRGAREHLLQGLEAGADDYVIKPFDPEELEMRIASGRRVVELHEQLLYAATHDPLSGLLNRRALLEQEEAELTRSRRTGEPVSVAMMDLDRFKAINDRYGHLAGDEVLREAARLIQCNLREYDLCGRYGGEEFLLVFPGASAFEAAQVCERLRFRIADAPLEYQGQSLAFTASFGVAEYDRIGSLDALNAAADEALYRAKEAGRDRVVW